MFMFRLLLKKAYELSFLVVLCLLFSNFLINIPAVHAKNSAKKIHSVRRNQSNYGGAINLADHDRENAEQFVTMASLKLYGIYIGFYNQVLRENVNDFDTALAILTEANDFSNKMEALAHSQQFKEFFISAKYFFKFKIEFIKQIAEEAKNNKFRPEFNDLVVDIFIKGKDHTATLTPQEQMLIDKWNAQSKKNYQEALQTSTNSLRDTSALYKINSINYLDNISTIINFQLPLNDDLKEGEYIYTTYIKGTQLPDDIKLYYYKDFFKYAITAANIVGYDLIQGIDLILDKFLALGAAEAGLLEVIVASGPIGIGLAAVAYLTYKYTIYKAGKVAEEVLKNFVHQVSDLDKAIVEQIARPEKDIISLLEMENQVKRLIPTNETRYLELQKLVNLTESYLMQRKQIGKRALQSQAFSTAAMGVADKSIKIQDALDYAQWAKKFLDNKDKLFDLFNKSKPSERITKGDNPNDPTNKRQDIKRENEKSQTEDKGKFSVKGNTVTNLQINRGDSVTISATGQVLLGKRVGSCGPDGRQTSVLETGALIVKGGTNGELLARHGVLLARVNAQGNESWIIVGSGKTFVAPNSGVLELQVNDKKYDDNEGGFDVQVTINRAK